MQRAANIDLQYWLVGAYCIRPYRPILRHSEINLRNILKIISALSAAKKRTACSGQLAELLEI
jgi:hypothetical protein